MARTVQSISQSLVETAKKQNTTSSSIPVHSEEPKLEDNISLLFSIADSLNNLCTTLENIKHKAELANLEMRIRAKYNKEASPQAAKKEEEK